MYDKTIKKYFAACDSTNPDGYHIVLRAQEVIDFRHESKRPKPDASDSEKKDWIEKSSLIEAENLVKEDKSSEKLIVENLKQYKFTDEDIKKVKEEAYAQS